MKLLIQTILNSAEALRKLNNLELSMQTSLKLVHNIKGIEEAFTEYEKKRVGILRKNGEGEGEDFKILPDKLDITNQAVKQLQLQKVNITIQ